MDPVTIKNSEAIAGMVAPSPGLRLAVNLSDRWRMNSARWLARRPLDGQVRKKMALGPAKAFEGRSRRKPTAHRYQRRKIEKFLA